MKPIEIFKAGTHTDMSGNKHTVTVADLVKTATSYSSDVHEAPFVVGHPKADHPAYGWAGKLTVDGDRLIAHPVQVMPEFAELVECGAYKKRSASFYPPDAASNPTPGSWYLRHVGFLGAQPPAIKGLRDVEFSESDGCVEFGENQNYAIKLIHRMFSGIRDFLIEKNGVEETNRIIPSWDINYLAELADEAEPASNFSEGSASVTPPAPAVAGSEVQPIIESQTKGDDEMSEALKQQLAVEKTARETAEKKLAALEAAQAKSASEALAKDNAEFAEGLIKEGKLLPKNKDKVLSLLNAQPQIAEFAEGESPVEILKGLLAESPKVVDFSETAKKGEQGADGTVDYAEGTSPASIEFDKKVRAHMTEHKVDYSTAFVQINGR